MTHTYILYLKEGEEVFRRGPPRAHDGQVVRHNLHRPAAARPCSSGYTKSVTVTDRHRNRSSPSPQRRTKNNTTKGQARPAEGEGEAQANEGRHELRKITLSTTICRARQMRHAKRIPAKTGHAKRTHGSCLVFRQDHNSSPVTFLLTLSKTLCSHTSAASRSAA